MRCSARRAADSASRRSTSHDAKPLGVQRAVRHRGDHGAIGFALVTAVGEAAACGQLVDVGKGISHGVGVGGQSHGAHAWRVDHQPAAWAAGAAFVTWSCAVPWRRPERTSPVAATSSPAKAFVKRDLPAPDSPSSTTVLPATRARTWSRPKPVTIGHGDDLGSRVGRTCLGYERVEVVSEVGLAHDDRGRRAGIPGERCEALDATGTDGSVGSAQHEDGVEVGDERLLLAGVRVAPAQQALAGQHRLDGSVGDSDPVAHDWPRLERTPQRDRSRPRRRHHQQRDTVVAHDPGRRSAGAAQAGEQRRPASTPSVGFQRGVGNGGAR